MRCAFGNSKVSNEKFFLRNVFWHNWSDTSAKCSRGSHSSNVTILHISYLGLTAVSFSVCPRPALGVMPPVLTMITCYISLTMLVDEGSVSFMSSPVMTLLCLVKYLWQHVLCQRPALLQFSLRHLTRIWEQEVHCHPFLQDLGKHKRVCLVPVGFVHLDYVRSVLLQYSQSTIPGSYCLFTIHLWLLLKK